MRFSDIIAFFFKQKNSDNPKENGQASKWQGLLRITILAGLILIVLTGGVLTVFFFLERNNTREARQLDSFARIMNEYDLLFAVSTGTERDYSRLNSELDRLEKRAVTVESWLSVLKRRRTLSRLYPLSIEDYRKSVNKALEVYSGSQPIAAIAIETLIKNTAITREIEENLRNIFPVFTGSSFNSLRIALHILLGDFNSPQRAAVVPEGISSDGNDAVSIDLAILKVLRSDIYSAASDIAVMLQHEGGNFPSSEVIRFAAEYYYDFGDLNRSAELFSLINDDNAMLRQADALYLAGYSQSARAIWYLLSDMEFPVDRSIYNLGVTSPETDEAIFWFEKLRLPETTEITDRTFGTSRQYGLIHYSRLLDDPEAVSLLSSVVNLQPIAYPYIDLEIIKRQLRTWEIGRQIAETWLLLDRHDSNEELYLWAAWLFLYQRNYNEIKILLNRMEIPDFTKQWLIYKAIDMMFEGDLEEAENILRSIPLTETDWPVYANLGCIFEAQRSATRALEQYEIAAEKTPNPKTASRLQLRIARCYTALNRPLETRLALEKALELDPGNLTAKLELDRFYFSY